MKTITNVLGIGGGQPLLTPLLDSAQWIDVPVINASYEEVKLRFEHNGGINDLNGDANEHHFENESNDISVSPQELSTTFMLPMTVFNRRQELVDQMLMNLANAFLEAHLIYGGLGTKLFQNSPIKGALTFAHDPGSYTNVENLVRKAMYDLEGTQKRIISTLPTTTLGTNLRTLTDGALLNPYGKLIKDCVEQDGELPEEFVINSGSMILTGERTPRIERNDDLAKNTSQVTVAWFVAGVPTGLDVSMSKPAKKVPGGITINSKNVSMKVGEGYNVIATVTPSDADDKTVTYSVVDNTIATVTSAGRITGVKAGTTKVLAKTVNGITAEITVTVTDPAPAP